MAAAGCCASSRLAASYWSRGERLAARVARAALLTASRPGAACPAFVWRAGGASPRRAAGGSCGASSGERRPVRPCAHERSLPVRRDLDLPALHVHGDRVPRPRDDEVGPDDPHLDASRLDDEGGPPAPGRHVALDAPAVERHDDPVRIIAREAHRRGGAHVDRRLAELDARAVGRRLDARRAPTGLRLQHAPREAARDRREGPREDEQPGGRASIAARRPASAGAPRAPRPTAESSTARSTRAQRASLSGSSSIFRLPDRGATCRSRPLRESFIAALPRWALPRSRGRR